MKTPLRILALLVSFATLCCLESGAQDWQEKFYGKFDAGGSWVQDTTVGELFGLAVPGSTIKFNPGFRSGIGAGYNVTDWFAGEVEFGMSANGVKEIEGASHVEATLWNLPLMVNAKLQLPNRSILTPYIGAGVGGASSIMSIDDLHYGNSSIWGSASAFVFAYQAFGGVAVALNDNMSLGVEYRYVHSDPASYDIDWGSYYYVYNDVFKIGSANVQSVSLMFRIKF